METKENVNRRPNSHKDLVYNKPEFNYISDKCISSNNYLLKINRHAHKN